MKKLIKVSDIKELLAHGQAVELNAKVAPVGGGYYVDVTVNDEVHLLATYLSKPRLFKRADALLKEMAELGFNELVFDISEYIENQKKQFF